jgi:hypothetical protein
MLFQLGTAELNAFCLKNEMEKTDKQEIWVETYLFLEKSV